MGVPDKLQQSAVRVSFSDFTTKHHIRLFTECLADYLVNHNVPFRQAHEVIGKLVAYSIEQQRSFGEMTLEEFQRFSPAFAADVTTCLKLDTAMAARKGIGAPSPQNVKAQLGRWRKALTPE